MKQEINLSPGPEPILEWIPVAMIETDGSYQRKLVQSRLNKILRNFSWRYFQPVTLARQNDCLFSVLDGQHRVEAIRRHPLCDRVPAMVVQLEGVEAEAKTFVTVNTERTAVTAIDRYWAGLLAEDPDAWTVHRVVQAAGCSIAPRSGLVAAKQTNAIAAVSKTIRAFGEKATADAMRIITDAWPTDKKALKGTLINGIARLIRANPNADHARMSQILAENDFSSLTADAEAMRKIVGGSSEMAISRALMGRYNKGKRANLLSL